MAALGAGTVSAGAAGARAAGPPARAVPGELIARFRDGVGRERRLALRRAEGARLERRLPLPRAELLRVEPGVSVAAAVRALERRPEVVYAEPNLLFGPDAVPNDPSFGESWGLHSPNDVDIDAPQAWDLTRGDPSILVGVADDGVYVEHAEFGGGGRGSNVYRNPGESGGRERNGVDDDGNGYVDDVSGYDFYSDTGDASDYLGHGTLVAGALAALGGDAYGITGVTQRARLLPLKVRDEGYYAPASDVAEAYVYAARRGVRVVNTSGGVDNVANLVEDAIRAAPNTLFAFSAGNEGRNLDDTGGRYPCTSTAPNVLCVAATDRGDGLPGWSNWGPRGVDLGAPGVDVPTTAVPRTTPYAEGFEQEIAGRWTTGGSPDSWQRASSWGGHHEMRDWPAGGASDPVAVDNWLESKEGLDLRGNSHCRLRYAASINLRGTQQLVVEATSDARPWTRIGVHASPSVLLTYDDLTAFTGHTGVRVRFRLVGDDFRWYEGVAIDAIEVQCLREQGSARMWGGGTSVAAPHVSGVAALVAAHLPGLSGAEIRDRILAGVDPVAALEGRVASGGRLNAYGALLGHRAPPDPGERAAGAPAAGPSCTVRPRAGQSPRSTARRGYRARLRCDAMVSAVARLVVSRAAARRLGFRARPRRSEVTIARARAGQVTAKRLVLRASRRSAALLVRAKRLRARLRVTVTNAAGHRAALSRRVVLRR